MRSAVKPFFGAVAFVAVLCMVFMLASCGKHGQRDYLPYTEAHLDSFLLVSLHTKLLQRLDTDIEEARVNADIWNNLSPDAKKSSARMLAWYCARYATHKDAAANITIVNQETDETLARYNEMLGYSAER
jgi:hypothetical protein